MRDLVIKTTSCVSVPESPVTGVSPRADGGDADMMASFHSVKDAISLFVDSEPKASLISVNVPKKKTEQGFLELEAQHHLMMKARLHYSNQLKTIEASKAQALSELQMGDKTLQYLRNKLQTLIESKQASMEAAETAKLKAKELDEERARRAKLGSKLWKAVVNHEKELHKAAAAEVVACEEELINLRNDFDAAVVEKSDAIQNAEVAGVEVLKNQTRKSELEKEVDELRQKLDQIKLEEEEYENLMAEKEALLRSLQQDKERMEEETKCLREDCLTPAEAEAMQENLEETVEAIRVLQEIVRDLASARRALEEVVAEKNSLRTSIHSIRSQLEETRSERERSGRVAEEAESAAEQMQKDIETSNAELEEAMKGCCYIMHSCVEKLLKEAEEARRQAEVNTKNAEVLRKEAAAAASLTGEADAKLKKAMEEAEEAKAGEKAAEERMHEYKGNDRRIRLSLKEYNSMKKRVKECAEKADMEVAAAVAEAEAISAREKEAWEKLEEVMEENEALESEIKEALKQAEVAEMTKRLVQSQLLIWRESDRK